MEFTFDAGPLFSAASPPRKTLRLSELAPFGARSGVR